MSSDFFHGGRINGVGAAPLFGLNEEWTIVGGGLDLYVLGNTWQTKPPKPVVVARMYLVQLFNVN